MINIRHAHLEHELLHELLLRHPVGHVPGVRKGDTTVGNPHRAQTSQFELFDLEFLNSSFSRLSFWNYTNTHLSSNSR